MAKIEIRDCTKVYARGVRALDGLSLEVADGELLVLAGPSGSGKTTLLRLIAGLDEPTSGSIHLDGQNLAGVPPRKRDVALVFQNLALYEHLTVEQNLAFGASLKNGEWWTWRRTSPETKERIRWAANLLGIERLLDRRPAELSGGEQQRVAIGRAIIRRPKVLLLDEPLSSLDQPLRRKLRGELKQLQRELGVTTIYVTHDEPDALALAHRVAVIERGRLVRVGTPDETLKLEL